MKNIVFIIFLTAITVLSGSCSSGKIEFIQHEDRIDVMTEGKLIASYLVGQQITKPALYPVLTPSSDTVTRSFPFDIKEGESRDHPHHTGVFFTYGAAGEVNGNNYWANTQHRYPSAGNETPPPIRLDRIIHLKSGRNKAILKSVNMWVDKNDKPLLEENRDMEFMVSDDEYKIDFTITLKAVDTTVTFGDTKEGMFAIRVADWLAENARGTRYISTGEYLNASGERTDRNVWGRRSEWMRLEGEKDGKRSGVVIFHHPESVNFPTYWHARGYGLFAANPLGQFDFQRDRGEESPQHFSLTLTPGESALFKFRMVIYDGTRDKERLDREFENFSTI